MAQFGQLRGIGLLDGSDSVSVVMILSSQGFPLAGVLTPIPIRRNLALAVNLDPEAGDTTAVDPALLGKWIAALNARQLVTGQAKQSLWATSTNVNYGWFLLWMVLVLLLIELTLARWFSHARRSQALAPSSMPQSGQELGA